MRKTQVLPDESVKHTEESFWNRVIKKGPDECWPWTGPCGHDNHGIVGILVNRVWTSTTAQRFAFHSAKFPTSELVTAICDNPNCCNPNHLRAYQKAGDLEEDDMHCPKCGAKGISYGNIKISMLGVTVNMECPQCDHKWSHEYGLDAVRV